MTSFRLAIPIALVLCSFDGQAAVSASDHDSAHARLEVAEAAARDGDSGRVISTLKALVGSADYAGLDDKTKYRANILLAGAALHEGRWSIAHDALVRTSSSSRATPSDWWWRLDTAKLSGDFADASASLEKVLALYPDFATRIDDISVSALDEGLGGLPDDGAARFRFEQNLERLDWRPKAAFFSSDMIRYHYAVGLLERGETIRGRDVMLTLSTPFILPAVLADKRFDAWRIGDNTASDELRQTTETELDERRELVQARPMPYRKAALASTLYALGRYDEALSTATEALLAGPALPEADLESLVAAESLAKSVQVHSLLRLGRTKEALTIASTAWGGDVTGTDQPMLQAKMLVALGRGPEARLVLQPLNEGEYLRPASKQDLAALRLCAAVQMHETAQARAQRAYIESHPFQNARATLQALACVSDRKAAVAYAVRLLADPAHRHLMLVELQEFQPLQNPTAAEMALEDLRRNLRHDPHVLAALEPVGRINRFDLPITEALF